MKAGREEAPDWRGILDILCDTQLDPIMFKLTEQYSCGKKKLHIRSCDSYRTVTAIAAVFVIGSCFGILADYIIFPRTPNIFLNTNKEISIAEVTNLSGNLTAFLALIAAATTIVFTYAQLRAKVRADSRQAWVTTVRKLISNVLTNIHEVAIHGEHSPHFNSFHMDRTYLELHLNPSEKDHRLLMLLIRACVFPKLKLTIDCITAEEVMKELSKIKSISSKYNILQEIIKHFCEAIDDSDQKHRDIILKYLDVIVSFALKLSHSILKREWERVSYTR